MMRIAAVAGAAAAAEAPSATVLRYGRLQPVMCRTVAMFALALVVGIVNWLLLGLPLLPTISGTWTVAPASYISRYIVGTCCILFQVANVVIYRANQARAVWMRACVCVCARVRRVACSAHVVFLALCVDRLRSHPVRCRFSLVAR